MPELHTLPSRLKKYGFEYELIRNEADKALYSQHFEGQIIGYEVFMLKSKKQISLHSYPKHEDFGEKAWSFRSKQAALEFYNNIASRITIQTALPF